jgi:hypothetical protein
MKMTSYLTGNTYIDLHSFLWGLIPFLYLDDVRTSEKTRLWNSTACYGDSFSFYMSMIFVP